MELKYNLEESDMKAAETLASSKCRTLARSWANFVLNVGVWACIAVALTTLLHSRSRHSEHQTLGLIVVLLIVGAVASILSNRLAARRVRLLQTAALELPIEQRLMVLDEGLRFENRWSTSLLRWAIFQGIEELAQHVALVVRPYSVIVVPNRAFASAEERAAFVATVRETFVSAGRTS